MGDSGMAWREQRYSDHKQLQLYTESMQQQDRDGVKMPSFHIFWPAQDKALCNLI